MKKISVMLMSLILVACATTESNINQGKINTSNNVIKSDNKKLANKPILQKNASNNTNNASNKAGVVLTNKNPEEKKLPKMLSLNSLNKNDYDVDKEVLQKCEKSGQCLKEVVVVDNYMFLKVEMPDFVYNELKNKDNSVRYYDNEVKSAKNNPENYLKKYGSVHKKYVNSNEMFKELPEVQIKDLFTSNIFARFKPT